MKTIDMFILGRRLRKQLHDLGRIMIPLPPRSQCINCRRTVTRTSTFDRWYHADTAVERCDGNREAPQTQALGARATELAIPVLRYDPTINMTRK